MSMSRLTKVPCKSCMELGLSRWRDAFPMEMPYPLNRAIKVILGYTEGIISPDLKQLRAIVNGLSDDVFSIQLSDSKFYMKYRCCVWLATVIDESGTVAFHFGPRGACDLIEYMGILDNASNC